MTDFQAKPKHHLVVPMLVKSNEGKELHLPMTVLNGKEQAEVEANTYKDTLAFFNGTAPKVDVESNWKVQMDAQRGYWTVFYSVKCPDDLSKRFFFNKEQVEATYDWDQIGILMGHNLSVRISHPDIVNLDEKNPEQLIEMVSIIKNLGEESTLYLNTLSTMALDKLVRHLVTENLALKELNEPKPQ